MAEAIPQQTTSYYCHQCSSTIVPNLPDYTCPTCNGGFIEELQQPAAQPNLAQLFGPNRGGPPMFATPMQGRLGIRVGLPPGSGGPPFGRSFSAASDGDDSGHMGAPHHAGQHHGIFLYPDQMGGGGSPFTNLLEQILSSLTFGNQAPLAQVIGLHGNPGDYVWGQGGMDEIITQLMNQMVNSGPPPATQEQINGLQPVEISQENVDQNLQCNVCFEDYKLNERDIVKLPCQHIFHKDCIAPWLTRNGTCPICRKTLEGEDTSCVENAQSIPETLENFGINVDGAETSQTTGDAVSLEEQSRNRSQDL